MRVLIEIARVLRSRGRLDPDLQDRLLRLGLLAPHDDDTPPEPSELEPPTRRSVHAVSRPDAEDLIPARPRPKRRLRDHAGRSVLAAWIESNMRAWNSHLSPLYALASVCTETADREDSLVAAVHADRMAALSLFLDQAPEKFGELFGALQANPWEGAVDEVSLSAGTRAAWRALCWDGSAEQLKPHLWLLADERLAWVQRRRRAQDAFLSDFVGLLQDQPRMIARAIRKARCHDAFWALLLTLDALRARGAETRRTRVHTTRHPVPDAESFQFAWQTAFRIDFASTGPAFERYVGEQEKAHHEALAAGRSLPPGTTRLHPPARVPLCPVDWE